MGEHSQQHQFKNDLMPQIKENAKRQGKYIFLPYVPSAPHLQIKIGKDRNKRNPRYPNKLTSLMYSNKQKAATSSKQVI
jgi:hypothetical protein